MPMKPGFLQNFRNRGLRDTQFWAIKFTGKECSILKKILKEVLNHWIFTTILKFMLKGKSLKQWIFLQTQLYILLNAIQRNLMKWLTVKKIKKGRKNFLRWLKFAIMFQPINKKHFTKPLNITGLFTLVS